MSLTLKFVNRSQNATSYAWDFGDGETSTEQNPEHTYAEAGAYVVTLTVTGPTGVVQSSQGVVAND